MTDTCKLSNEILSPSGQYKLVISSIAIKPGCWNYTEGQIFSTETNNLIASVKRNYSSFPATFVENHPNGHNYLVCGANYQGQTVIELDTGKRNDILSQGTDKGFGFCWVEHNFDINSKILIVLGCHWACPYEFRFFDFSDPMNGWKEIVFEDECMFEDARWPEIDGNIIKCYQTTSDDDNKLDDEYNKITDIEIGVVKSINTLQREGLKLTLLNEWVSQEEQEYRKNQKEARERYELKMKNYRETDPLYLAYLEFIKDPALSVETYESTGITYKGWCKGFEAEEQRMCRRIVKNDPYTIDLEWATQTGPIKLVIYKNGKSHSEKIFKDHTVESLSKAFKYVKKLIS